MRKINKNPIVIYLRLFWAVVFVLTAWQLGGCGEDEPEVCTTDDCTRTCQIEDEGDVGHCEYLDELHSYCWCEWSTD